MASGRPPRTRWLTVLLAVATQVLLGCSGGALRSALIPASLTQTNPPASRTPLDWHVGAAIYVGNVRHIGNAFVSEIDEFAQFAKGNVAPFNKITGPLTQLNDIHSMASDKQGYLYVASPTILPPPAPPPAILVFAPYSSGNIAPVRVISGNLTELNDGFIGKIDVDAAGTVYAAVNGKILGNARILVFAPGANGNVHPIRVVIPPFAPHGTTFSDVAVGFATLYVFEVREVGPFNAIESIALYPLTANGITTPFCKIAGGEIQGSNLHGFAASAFPNNSGSGTIWAMLLTSSGPRTLNTYEDCVHSPVARLHGSLTGFILPQGIAADGSGNLYELETGLFGVLGTPSVNIFAPNNQNGDVSPNTVIQGPKTDLESVYSITIGLGSPLVPP